MNTLQHRLAEALRDAQKCINSMRIEFRLHGQITDASAHWAIVTEPKVMQALREHDSSASAQGDECVHQHVTWRTSSIKRRCAGSVGSTKLHSRRNRIILSGSGSS
jgi:hypothetical protein